MEQRQLGQLWPVSALTLGGGGIGSVWGETSREEAVATVRAAVDGGITLLDVAPGYGRGEAERVVGEAFAGDLPDGVRITTKCQLGNPPRAEVEGIIRGRLERSLETLRLERVDLFFLHSNIIPDGYVMAHHAETQERWTTDWTTYTECVRPTFEALVREGKVGAWGITGVGLPQTIIEALRDDPAPAAVQCVANLLDSPGGMRQYREPPQPRDIIAAAHERGVGVLGIRAVQAGALTAAFDRDLPADDPDTQDFERAAPFRELAAHLGESPAALAHRYALMIDGVDTVILGVKNRTELAECLAAEAAGPLPLDLMARIDQTVGRIGSDDTIL